MSTINDEKFISIKYDTWKNKYLPMEEENNKLKRKIQELEESKKYKLIFDLKYIPTYYEVYPNHHRLYDMGREHEVGAITFHEASSNIFSLEVHNKEILEQCLTRTSVDMIISRSVFLELEEQLKIKADRFHVERRKYQEMFTDNKLLIKKIPKWLRWLYKIKE